MANPPNSYKDPYWTNLSTIMEKKHGLPAGLLVNIVQKGEKTNNDRQSPVGAKTVYQIMPNTRKLFLNKYGVDAFSSPQAAAEVAALHLKESLQRNKGDVGIAVREYHGGPNRKGWGKVNEAYVGRVLGGSQTPSTERPSRLERAKSRVSSRRELEQPSLDGIYRAYKSGSMTPEESREYERDVQNGAIMLSRGQSLSKGKKSQEQQGMLLPQAVADAYFNNTMDADARADLERDRKAGLVRLPTPTNMQSDLPDFNDQGVAQAQPKELTEVLQAPKSQSLGQNILGTGETALSIGTGALGGLSGVTAGTFHGVAKSLIDGEFGTQQGAQNARNAASNVAQALTYEPRTQAGQQQAQALGEFVEDTGLNSLPPTLGGGLGTAAATMGRASLPQATVSANNIAQSAKPIIAQAVEASKAPINAARSAASRAAETLGINRNQNPSTSPAPSNIGAAQVDQATLREALAEDLPIPMGNLMTEGQLSRDPSQLKFEVETAKQKIGDPLRRRYEEQHEAVNFNLEQFNEMTGSDLGNRRDVGLAVDKALKAEMTKDKIKVRTAYKAAEKSDEANTVVDLTRPVSGVVEDKDVSLVNYLNDQVASVTEPILDSSKKLAVRHGLAIEEGGALIPTSPTIKQMEAFRKDIIAKTDSMSAPDIRQSTIIKKLVDAHTEPYEGTLYKKARGLKRAQMQRWESHNAVKELTSLKKGTEDRKVAYENVADRVIKSGSLDDLRQVKRTLLTSGDDGKQAWKELQGQAIRDIKEVATAGIAPDANGKQMISPHALNKAINDLDKSGKLDYLFGKKGAEQLRALNDVSKAMFTVPASAAINHSNTASAIAAMIDATTMLGAGVPVPVASALKIATNHIKDRKIKARVNQALRLDTRSGGI